ncbi:hypothetical protein JXM67_07580 [candidate division WOR-3 bacterium]|nr:hypothetical protein [candidate division WOR-3 bacterium]
MRKIILAIAALVLLISATPVSAQLAGTWTSEGTGYCYPRNNVIIHPWQTWKGEIPNTMDLFKGDWYDADGNHGIFKGEPVPSIPEIAVYKGAWYWYDPASPSSRPRYGGEFEMTFYFMSSHPYCEGTWTTIWPTPYKVGTMKGEKVD